MMWEFVIAFGFPVVAVSLMTLLGLLIPEWTRRRRHLLQIKEKAQHVLERKNEEELRNFLLLNEPDLHAIDKKLPKQLRERADDICIEESDNGPFQEKANHR